MSCFRTNHDSVCIIRMDGQGYISEQGGGGRYADYCVRQLDRCVGGSVMIWAGITTQNRTNLVLVNGTLNATRYQQNKLATECRQFINQHGPAITFQQDRPHTARATQAFLQQNSINVLSWSSKSPDLDPIEHIWDELDRQVRLRPNGPATLGSDHLIFMGGGRKTLPKKIPAVISGKKNYPTRRAGKKNLRLSLGSASAIQYLFLHSKICLSHSEICFHSPKSAFCTP